MVSLSLEELLHASNVALHPSYYSKDNKKKESTLDEQGNTKCYIRERDILFHASKSSGKLADRMKYTSKRNQMVNMVRWSKQTFF